MTMRVIGIGFVAGALCAGAAAADDRDDRTLIARAAEERAVPSSDKPEASADALAPEERRARVDVALSQIKLELVLARKALKADDLATAARHAADARTLIGRLPDEIDASVWELQADGITARAEKAGVKPAAQKRGRVAGARAVGQESQPAVSVTVPAGGVAVVPAVTPGATAASEAATASGVGNGSRVSVFQADLSPEQADELRLQYEKRLYDAYKAAEVRDLIEADEARVTPAGEIAYPANWAEISQKRAKYAGGEIAKSDPWTDKDGRAWYSAVYDIRDLTYEIPDFAPALTGDITEDMRNTFDREALRRGSSIFNGDAEDLARGIPLLRYFGGVDDMEFRGPKYSVEKQRQIMEQIKAFTTPTTEAKIVPLGAP